MRRAGGDALSVDEDAVLAAEVLELPGTSLVGERGVSAGDGGVGDGDVGLVGAAEGDGSGVEFDLASGVGAFKDGEFGHGVLGGCGMDDDG